MSSKETHLEMIQGIVNRLSHNSFLLKDWSVILVSGLFALAANNSNILFIYLSYFPVIAFWFLDGYFLWQERLFRALFDYVRGLEKEKIDFSMDTSKVKKDVSSWLGVVFSKTLLAFHGTIIVAIILVKLVVIRMNSGG